MSNSRLEKFIYAICGMDVDDLPTPLSRIETLWNCLITGEVPDFEPLSRNEKYLMAMLTDNVDGLPKPTSRSEKLLYKIATGETDLSDVPGYLSRYEELLKQLIENGGIGGTDFEYVLYTLNQPLSTLYATAEGPVKSAILKGQTLVNLSRNKNLECVQNKQFSLTKPNLIRGNKTYILIFTHTGTDGDKFAFQEYEAEVGWIINHTVALASNTPKQYYIFTTKENTGLMKVQSTTENNYTLNNLMVLEYQDGMENWDIPYFEGMQSVKMPVLTTSNEDGTKTNILSCNEEVTLRGIGEVKDTLDGNTGELTQRIGEVVLDGSDDEKWITNSANYGDNTAVFYIANLFEQSSTVIMDKFISYTGQNFWASVTNDSENHLSNKADLAIRISKTRLSSIDVSGFRQWLSQNPVTIQHTLMSESIKTVVLSTLDQDGEPTKLSTFNDITHVSIEAGDLLPTVDLEVPTKIEETLSTLPTLMNDISETQQSLNEKIDEQAENINEVSTAITEIHNDIL